MRKFSTLILFFVILLTAASRDAFAHKNHPHIHDKKVVEPPTGAKVEARFEPINESYQKDVKPIFVRSCFNCHSQSPELPWYHVLPVAKGLIEDDMKEAKEHLDFSRGFPFQGHGAPKEDLEAIADAVRDNSMPPFRYRFMHWHSSLSPDEKAAVLAWVEKSLKILNGEGGTNGVH